MWCTRHGIEHKLIPIGVKELNGKVENTHGFDDREFYSQAKGFKDYAALERNMHGWNERWNGLRHTSKLGWRTPNEVLANAYVGYLVFWLNWSERHQSPARLNDDGHFEIAALPPRKAKKAKRVSSVDRYLAWMEGGREKIPQINYRRAGDVQNFAIQLNQK